MKNVPQKSLKQKSLVITDQALMLGLFGRDGVIRTLDPLHPMQAVSYTHLTLPTKA